MRILIATGIYPPEIGGPATYSRTLETELPKRGIEVAVLPFRRVRRFPKVIRHIVYTFLILREGRGADVIYAQDPLSVGLPSALAALILRKKFILKVVGDYAWEQATQRFGFSESLEKFQYAKLPFLPHLLRMLERWVAGRAIKIIVPSKYLGKILSAWGVPKNKITVIYNGIEEIQDTGNKMVLRGLLKFHGKLIVSVGRLVPWKGFTTLIKTLPRFKEAFSDTKLLIIGGGPDLPLLESIAAAEGVSDDVIFAGALERDILIRYLCASDVFVLNTAYEGFSHLILEAMMVGVPVVTTSVGGNVEAVDHGTNGYLVPVDDREKIVAHTSALLSDANLRARIVLAGKRRAKQFSNHEMVEKTASFLKLL
jgi:glycosyltransferase involved in cell wall biosynthesis